MPKRNPQSVPELKRILIEEWNTIPHYMIDGLIPSAQEWLSFCLKENGASIRYLLNHK
jgi:hypothetical protein